MLIVLIVIVFWVLLGALSYWGHCKIEPGGKFWDSFGAINALFAGLAFAVVIYAILLQKKELELQREELQATRNEIKGQKEMLQRQNFENSFFQLLEFQNDIVNSITLEALPGVSGRICLNRMWDILKENLLKKITDESSSEEEILDATYSSPKSFKS